MVAPAGFEPATLSFVDSCNILYATTLFLAGGVGNDPTYLGLQPNANPSQLPTVNR